MKDITVLITARNEEDLIKECIESVHSLTKNVLMTNMESSDNTVNVAKSLGTTVYTVPPQPYVELVRTTAIEKVRTSWFLILDPDERLTPTLASEIKQKIDSAEYTSYKVPRKNIFAGRKWLKHGGWWPDYQIRLINKEAFKDWPQEIHSTPIVSGKQGFLKNPLLHFFHGDFEKMVEKTLVFEDIESELLFTAGRSASTLTFFRKFLGELYRRIIAKVGFLDGKVGIIEGIYQAFSKTITYLLLYEKKFKRQEDLPAGPLRKASARRADRVALYNPYLDTLGGGERLILSILKVFDEAGFAIDVFWDKDLTQDLKDRFNLTFTNLNFKPNIFNSAGILSKLFTLSSYDYFFYVTDGSYFFSSAKNNFVFVMVPQRDMYTFSFLNRLKLRNYRFITISAFTHKKLQEWGISSAIVYPFISDDFFGDATLKEKQILMVGRFFGQLHSKKHSQAIEAFRKLKREKEFKDYTLILAGGAKPEDQSYLNKLQELIENDPSIIIRTNLSYPQLVMMYKKSEIFWHFTGFGIDEKESPELVEHLGITPLEAMAASCITYCYNAGGPKELLKDGETGFLFNSIEELIEKSKAIVKNSQVAKTIRKNAVSYVQENFSYDVFKTHVRKIILEKNV